MGDKRKGKDVSRYITMMCEAVRCIATSQFAEFKRLSM